MNKKRAIVDKEKCVACGECEKNCPLKAITIFKGCYAKVDVKKCVGCAKCLRVCPASVISLEANR